MTRQIKSGNDARAALLNGINKLADAVSATLGPGGRLVLIESPHNMPPYPTKDGVTVAREIELEDPIENMGARLVRLAASRTVETVGDGTTTATVIARALFREAHTLVAAGSSPQALKRDMERAAAVAEEAIRAMARVIPAGDPDGVLARVATISANGDEETGRIVAEAVSRVGPEGVITVEESRDLSTSVETHDGLHFDSGWLSPGFVVDPPPMEVTLTSTKGVLVMVTNQEIRFITDFLPMLEYAVWSSMPLLLIADAVNEEPLGTMIQNNYASILAAKDGKLSGLRCCAVMTPRVLGGHRDALARDICAVSGAPYVTEDSGMSIRAISHLPKEKRGTYFGRVAAATISRERTILTATHDRAGAIFAQAAMIREEIEHSDSESAKKALRRRLARLVSGVVTIKVGGVTEAAASERRDLYEDAMFAARAAMAEGIVAGGGVALIDAIAHGKLRDLHGAAPLMKAMRAPAEAILRNAGYDPALVSDFGRGKGCDVRSGLVDVVDMVKAGVIDPAKVVSEALRNAVSVAGVLLSTEVVMPYVREEKKA